MLKWMLTVLLLFTFAFSGVSTTGCVCYEAGNYTGRSAPISNSYDPDGFSPCYTDCSYVAYAGDDSHYWTRLTFHWGTTTNSGGLIQIFDGPLATGTPLIQISEGENVLSGSSKSNIKSTLPRITVKYTQTGNGINIYYGVIKALPNAQIN
ncbi:CUB_2 domain-containing protein [Caenorhabditis elegans]|uniref:CUB_2 domain-containing protein n=1 Tax=Caenorhabditis elegans TaxID=6239 RepID=B3GWB3_CAEEL|nr:CUB_2 domain-containing protein [Caenorhabditis elegans]CAQ58101.1 CUB_2 domain-containing protein [Caenorhabditis elegans]|eukprot:NP_001129923.1 Uncharacterized protein CELE_E02H4.7 [Caenorhabditis elegans]